MVDPTISSASSGIAELLYLTHGDPESCDSVEESTSAPPGTCANTSYQGAFSLMPGTHTVYFLALDHVGNENLLSSDTVVAMPAITVVTPSSGSIYSPITVSGHGFGPYEGALTRVLIGPATAEVTAWLDTSISIKIPVSLSSGTYNLRVARDSIHSETAVSTAASFQVIVPVIDTMTPNYGLEETLVTMRGSGFGQALSTDTRVLLGGATVEVSVWNDTEIRWLVPDVAQGTYSVVAVREPPGGFVQSNELIFNVGSEGFGGLSFGFERAARVYPDAWYESGMNIVAKQGGRLKAPAGAAVTIPVRALPDDRELFMRRVRTSEAAVEVNEARDSAKTGPVGEAMEFGPEGTQFNTPVTIEIPYDPSRLGRGDEGQVAIHWYNPEKKTWDKLDTELDRVRHVARARTTHFSLYQPLAPILPAAALDEFGLRDQYAFPNPSRQGAAVTFRIQPGIADSVEVRVYDLSGRKIHQSSSFSGPLLFDDGNGKGAQHTYDGRWDVSGVASGVYQYVIVAKKAGQKDIVEKGKVGVIR